MKKKATLSFDSKIYDDYKKYCKEKGYILSRRIEIFMEEQLDRKEGE